MATVWVLNGPNLNRLGSRQPEIYGTASLDDIAQAMQGRFPNLDMSWRQTNDEAELIGWLHDAIDQSVSVVLNAGAFTHYSYALADAAKMVTDAGRTLVEVHLSNPAARESFRQHSVLSPVVSGVIQGFGAESYALALNYISNQ
mgnify:CR=1 FL=1